MQISILQTTVGGTAVYVETQTPTTNASGLLSIAIGTGTPVNGTFATIDWSADTYLTPIILRTGPNNKQLIEALKRLKAYSQMAEKDDERDEAERHISAVT